MKIIPAIDLYQGRVVRLERGDYAKCKVYSENPQEVARRWVEEGARWLHVVDLEGARAGRISNEAGLKKILTVGASVQWGGGVRSLGDIEKVIKLGVRRVILGTKALDPTFLKEAVSRYDEMVGLSLDVRDEEVQIEGWLKPAQKNLFEYLKSLKNYPIRLIVVTDIERDGTLKGINLTKIQRIVSSSPCPVIISGGISSLEDMRSLHAIEEKAGNRLSGVIIGKALYEGKLTLKEAAQAVRKRT